MTKEQIIFACDAFCKACANNPCGGVCRQNCKELDNFINELRKIIGGVKK